ncbi:hypothetical protein KM043_015109 [Ampulex compressa]|nr:hypothetical protein KM043_015109 [Ampulex compressa]
MLKVVGASWLQTRISTYILVAVALLGIGAIILGEFGHVENDGTYAATVSWNHKGGYRIDFWGQGNDLTAIPMNAARAYYKTGIFESGWSIIEIETSRKYPDVVQAYAAGLLEGSLTWQLIHHHWYNTVYTFCEKRVNECRNFIRYLRDNTAIIRERAELLESTDPFWHMVRLFYAQLDGLETGWKFAVRRSRQSVEMESDDFLWLAMVSDFSAFERAFNNSDLETATRGMIFLKTLQRENLENFVAIGHKTAGPYTKMLRLLKKYTFGYHMLPTPKSAALVPSHSIMMSSYPGALSSHDEFYTIQGENRELIIAGTPLSLMNRTRWNYLNLRDQVMSSVKTMAANRLATDAPSWSRIIALQNNEISSMQWIAYEPRTTKIWLLEQAYDRTYVADHTREFTDAGFVFCAGAPNSQQLKNASASQEEEDSLKNRFTSLQKNITTLEHFRKFMRGYSQEEPVLSNQSQRTNVDLNSKLTYNEDSTIASIPFGIIDTKIVTADIDGLESFEAYSGPARVQTGEPFKWSENYPNVSHIGHPDIFNFDGVTPVWVWV